MSKMKVVLIALVLVMMASAVFAQDTATGDTARTSGVRWGAIAAAFVLGIAAAAGAIGQSRAIVAACEGIARNPQAADKIQTPLILCLALMESLVIFALIIAFLLQGKISM